MADRQTTPKGPEKAREARARRAVEKAGFKLRFTGEAYQVEDSEVIAGGLDLDDVARWARANRLGFTHPRMPRPGGVEFTETRGEDGRTLFQVAVDRSKGETFYTVYVLPIGEETMLPVAEVTSLAHAGTKSTKFPSWTDAMDAIESYLHDLDVAATSS